MNLSFACPATEAFSNSRAVRRFKNIERVARRKLLQLRAATVLDSLRVDQWRVCFVWKVDVAHRVEIVDHRWESRMTKLLDEVHPGEIPLEDFMKPMGISARQLAADIDVSPGRISELDGDA